MSGGGVHGWTVFEGPARPRVGRDSSGREPRGGGPALCRGRLDGVSLGGRGARRGAARGQADAGRRRAAHPRRGRDRKSTRLNSSHANISYAVFCLKKKKV